MRQESSIMFPKVIDKCAFDVYHAFHVQRVERVNADRTRQEGIMEQWVTRVLVVVFVGLCAIAAWIVLGDVPSNVSFDHQPASWSKKYDPRRGATK